MKKAIGRFFPVLSSVKASNNNLKGSTSYSDNYCGTYESVF